MASFVKPQFQAWGTDPMRGFGSNLTVVDKVPPHMMHLVDPYWYQFPPMNPLWHSILGFTIFMLGVISIIGNGCVVFIFTTTKALRTPSNLFVVNLAFSDFMMMATNAPAMVVNCYHETWHFGARMCDIYAMTGSLFGCVSIWSMTMIAFDRYNVIVKGLSGKPLTTCGAVLRVLAIWLNGALWSLAPIFGWNRYVPEGNMTGCGTDYLTRDRLSRSYIMVYSFFVYTVPLSLIIYSYFYIVQVVSAHEKNMREQAKKMNVASLRSNEDKEKSAEARLAKVALITISLWFMAWTPYLVINFTGIFQLGTVSPLNTIWGAVFAKTSAVYNPIIYAISHPKYKAALFKTCPCLSCCDGDGHVQHDGQSTVSESTVASDERA